jgi:molybdopterin-guanine dinucleotide biosynthesis protein A
MDIQAIRNEIEKRKAANYTYLFLSDRPGDIMDKDNCIIHPMHRTWTKNLERDMEKALEYIAGNPNPGYPYRLGFCRKVRGACDVVMIQGEGQQVQLEQTENEPTITTIEPTMNEPVRTFAEALEDRAKIERLEYMVRERDRKISELEEEITALYSDIQDQETTEMADGTVNLINQLAPLLPALADKYFELQERKINMMQGRPAPQPQPQQAQESGNTIYDDYGL